MEFSKVVSILLTQIRDIGKKSRDEKSRVISANRFVH